MADNVDGMRSRQQSTNRRTALKSLRRKDTLGIMIFGNERVGKTALIKRWLNGTFADSYSPTVEDYYTKMYTRLNQRVTLGIIDTSGSNQFPAMLELYLKKCDAVMYVYDVTNQKSIDALFTHHDLVRRLGGDKVVHSVVGTKADLLPSHENNYDNPKVNEFLRQLGGGARHVLTSAKLGMNVETAFTNAVSRHIEIPADMPDDGKGSGKDDSGNQKKRKKFICC